MSPASYRAAPPRVASTTLAHATQEPQNALPGRYATRRSGTRPGSDCPTSAATAAATAVPLGVGVVLGGDCCAGGVVACPPVAAAVRSCLSAPCSVASKPMYWPKLTSTYFNCGYELFVSLWT